MLGTLDIYNDMRAVGFDERQAGALASSHYRFMLAIHGCKSPKAV